MIRFGRRGRDWWAFVLLWNIGGSAVEGGGGRSRCSKAPCFVVSKADCYYGGNQCVRSSFFCNTFLFYGRRLMEETTTFVYDECLYYLTFSL